VVHLYGDKGEFQHGLSFTNLNVLEVDRAELNKAGKILEAVRDPERNSFSSLPKGFMAEKIAALNDALLPPEAQKEAITRAIHEKQQTFSPEKENILRKAWRRLSSPITPDFLVNPVKETNPSEPEKDDTKTTDKTEEISPEITTSTEATTSQTVDNDKKVKRNSSGKIPPPPPAPYGSKKK